MLISEGVSIGREMRGGRLSRLLFPVMLAESPLRRSRLVDAPSDMRKKVVSMVIMIVKTVRSIPDTEDVGRSTAPFSRRY